MCTPSRRGTTSLSSRLPWPCSASARPERLTATSRRLAGAAPTTAIGWAGALFALTAVGAYVTADRIPLDTYRIGADASQLVWLALFFIVAAVPFTCAGVAVVAALRHSPTGAGSTYGASLAGSAAGAALALPLLAQVGSAATILLAAALGAAAPVVAAPRLAAIGAGLASIALVVGAIVIAPAGPRVSIHSQLAQALQRPDTRRLDTKLSANSRVDILQNAGFRTTTGLSLNYAGPIPRPRIGLTVDGGNAAALDVPVAEALDQVPLTHAIGIRPAAAALLLDPIGAFDAAVLLRAGVDQVDLVQPDAALRQAWHDVGDATVLNDDRVRVLDQGVRSALRSAGSYDLVIWPLRESFQGVAAGTFGLRETYALTRNALADGWRALAPNGRLVVTRWLQATPSESVRMWASLLDALRQAGVADPAAHVLAWRSLEVATMVASPTAFTSDERQALSDRFVRDGFDWVFHVKLQEADSNRFNRLPDTSLHRAFQAVVRGEPTPACLGAQSPTTAPTSFTISTGPCWREILSTTGRTWQPFGGAGFLVLVPLAAAATGTAVLTMIAPLMGRRRRGARRVGLRRLAFVAAAGVAFTATQIALLQRLILVLDAPTFAFATGIAAMLAWAGLGSLSSRWWRPTPGVAAATAALSVALLGGLLLAAPLALGAPLAVRVAVGVLAAMPSLALGTVMPSAIRALATDRSAISWAWAVNGTASVAAAFVAAILIVSVGFAWTLLCAALAYAVAVPLWRATDPRRTPPR